MLASSSAIAGNGGVDAKVQRIVKCGMTKVELLSRLGSAKSAYQCGDSDFESAALYGTTWVYLRGGAVYALIDHKNFKGPCVQIQTISYPGVTAQWICGYPGDNAN